MKIITFLAIAALSMCAPLSFGQSAGTQTGTAGTKQTDAAEDDQLHANLTLYLWLAGMHGDVGAPAAQASVHASPADLLSKFRFGILAQSDLRWKRVIAPIDLIWMRLGDDKALTNIGQGDTTADVRLGEVIFTPKIGYRLVDREKFKFDALTGFRYWHVGTKLTFNPSRLGRDFSTSLNWVDPVVGGRITADLSPKLKMTIAGDVGGWGAGSQLDYQLVGVLGYQFKPKYALQFGYRYMDVNYRSFTAVYDVAMSGAFIGFTFNLK